MATVWGTFGLPDDPSRGGSPPVTVPGVVRLLLELAFFASGIAAFWLIGQETLAVAFGGLVLIHHVLSWDRISWLLDVGAES